LAAALRWVVAARITARGRDACRASLARLPVAQPSVSFLLHLVCVKILELITLFPSNANFFLDSSASLFKKASSTEL